MNQIQKWIATLAGVTQAERERYEFAREFFGRRPFDTSTFQTPACWRRTAVTVAHPPARRLAVRTPRCAKSRC